MTTSAIIKVKTESVVWTALNVDNNEDPSVCAPFIAAALLVAGVAITLIALKIGQTAGLIAISASGPVALIAIFILYRYKLKNNTVDFTPKQIFHVIVKQADDQLALNKISLVVSNLPIDDLVHFVHFIVYQFNAIEPKRRNLCCDYLTKNERFASVKARFREMYSADIADLARLDLGANAYKLAASS